VGEIAMNDRRSAARRRPRGAAGRRYTSAPMDGPRVAGQLAPPARVEPGCPHQVQFYEHDAYLLASLTQYFANALRAGRGCVAIATPAHRAELERLLAGDGLDVAGLRAAGRLTLLDAADTLATFSVDDELDVHRFHEAVGGILAKAAHAGEPVCVFGEMVALLVEDERWHQAIQLEQMWEELARAHRFRLLCAYSMRSFSTEVGALPYRQLAEQHDRVIPAESYAALPSADDRLREIGTLQQKANALEAEVLRRKEIERELSRREQELTDFVENANEGIHKVGPDGTILWANKAELELLGYAPAEYVGHRVNEFHADAEACETLMRKLVAGEAVYNFPARLRCKDGSIRDVLVHSSARWQDGRFRYSRCFTRDVTALRRMEDQLERALASEQAARKEAEAGNRAKDLFLSLLSHELRTPLSVILGWTYLLRRTSDRAKVLEAVDVIEQNARLQTDLVMDLLDLTRIISGKLGLELTLVEMPDLVATAVANVRDDAQAQGLQLESRIQPIAEPVHGDPTRLQQALHKLLANAIKFTPAGGSVSVSLERAGARVRVVVQDTGAGISAELLPHVFDRFRRVDSALSRKHGGLGIGLAIAKEIVEMHGGRLRADSAGDGKGATFVVELPLAAGCVVEHHGLPRAPDQA
jgi:PAS domain S-box-containing protein